MENILYINACVRENSRTKKLADHLVAEMGGNVTRLSLQHEDIRPLDRKLLQFRDSCVEKRDYSSPLFFYARQFAAADTVVIAAPFWDLGMPALLKIYLEAVTVAGITFEYLQGIPHGLCKARRLIYVTTAGGPIMEDYGYRYAQALAQRFFGIDETVCFRTEKLDMLGADIPRLLAQTETEIDIWLAREKYKKTNG